MRELDLLLAAWLERHAATMAPDTLDTFERLLECTDMDLHDWLTGRAVAPDSRLRHLLDAIRQAS